MFWILAFLRSKTPLFQLSQVSTRLGTPTTPRMVTPLLLSSELQVHDTLIPDITLSGPSTIKLEVGAEFVDPGASAVDEASGETQAFSDLDYLPGTSSTRATWRTGNDALLNLDNDGGLLACYAVERPPVHQRPRKQGHRLP